MLRVELTDLTYTGVGQSLKFQSSQKGGSSYQTIEVTITEAKVYEESPSRPVEHEEESNSVEVDRSPEALPALMVIISCGQLKNPIKAGQEINLTLFSEF